MRLTGAEFASERAITNDARFLFFDELAADVINDYEINDKRAIKEVRRNIEKHLKPVFRGWKAAAITTADIRKYIVQRQAEQAANATINRELSTLKRAFSLGIEAGKLTFKPKIPLLRENNVRKGFFEPQQFETVRAHLPEPLQGLVTFAYITGWRGPSEVLPLQWRQVDFTAGTVRLDAGTTKNGEARVFPFTMEIRAILEAQRAYTDTVQRDRGIICPWVFHRNGARIKDYRGAWASACKNAGCPGMIPHDFRRTAVRTLVRAGIPERVAMTMTGHKTRSVFERYNIVSPGDLTEAARRLDAVTKLTGTIAGTVGARSTGSGPTSNG